MTAETITNFDIFLILESKVDSAFLNMQFKINGYKLFRRDLNRFGGFLNNHSIVPNAEIICNEFHQLNHKWILLECYKPPTQNDLEFIESITKIVDFYLQKFENLFIIDDLNMTTENTHLNDLLQMYDLTALIKELTCCQSQNPNCIDHFLTNRKALFKYCKTFETGLSDQHKLTSTIMKSCIFKGPPKKKIYWSYKKFDHEYFSNALREELETLEVDTYGEFEKKFTNVLNTHAPIKTKMIRFNNNVFITKELRKEIMKRSKLRNKFNRNRNHENWCNFKFQRNYCVNLLRKTKKQYYKNLNVKNVVDNQTFWKTVKPYFSDKGSNSRRITLLENDSILTDDKDIAKTMNNFFINITKNLNLKPYKDSSLTNINEITSNFDNHVSVKKIKESFPNIVSSDFNFQEFAREDIK